MLRPSGADWCHEFPGSNSIDDLAPPFRENVRRFVGALTDARAVVHISATYRPPERAYLMHWCCMIADGKQDPDHVPMMAGVLIDWSHGGNVQAAKDAARAMKAGYGIAYPAALVSRHTQRLAIDMTISWTGILKLLDERGIEHLLAPADHQDLWAVGASYGVHKLVTDAPHWSSDGH